MNVALQLLGAVAGLSAVATAVGGGLLWIRFSALSLPADEAVALLPKALLLTIGLHALFAPVLLAVTAGVAVALLGPLDDDNTPNAAFWWVLAIGGALAGAAALWQVHDEELIPDVVIVVGVLAIALLAICLVARTPALAATALAWTIAIGVVLSGAAVSVARTHGRPVMEPVAVIGDSGKLAATGFYIGQTSDRLYIAPLPGDGRLDFAFADADVDRVLEIPRDSITRIAMRAGAGIRADEPGREQAASLLRDLQAEGIAVAAPKPIRTDRPEQRFAPLVNLHAHENSWPMTVDEFLANSWLLWAHDDCRDWSPTLGREVNPKDLKGGDRSLDPSRLGPGPRSYSHVPAPGGCADAMSPVFTAGSHTRPYDLKQRAAGLPVREGFYLQLDRAHEKGDERLRQDGAQTMLSGIPVYYERHGAASRGKPALRITYWFFYGRSQPPGEPALTKHVVHQGDWERISVLLEIRPGGRYLPVSVRFHSHDGHRDVPWSAVTLVSSEAGRTPTHAVVFSAKGSHASYARAGSYSTAYQAGGQDKFTVHDIAMACPRCPQWRTWENIVDATEQPWYGFGGAWGKVGQMSGTTGPLGPSSYKTGKGLSPSPNSVVPPDLDSDGA